MLHLTTFYGFCILLTTEVVSKIFLNLNVVAHLVVAVGGLIVGIICKSDLHVRVFFSEKTKKRKKRPCPFCNHLQSDLRRHIIMRHKSEEAVAATLKKERDGEISRKDRIKEFAKWRKEGMYKQNVKLLSEDKELIGVKHSEGKKKFCSNCKGAYHEKYFYKHKKACDTVPTFSVPIPVQQTSKNPEFEAILRKMRKDEMYSIIQGDELIQLIGEHIFMSKKPNKKKEAKVKARNAMRRLARLVNFSDSAQSCLDLFKIEHFHDLEEAIIKLSNESEVFKPGLSVAIGTLIKTASSFLRSHFIIEGKRDLATSISEFREIFGSFYPKMFAKAEYLLKEKRQRESRKPQALPKEEDLDTLIKTISTGLEHFSVKATSTRKEYVKLRKYLLARLTLLNARRGSEVSRMKIQDYMDRNSWISESIDRLTEDGTLTDNDKSCLEKYSVAYIMGKGSKLVPILIPRDLEKCLDMLVDESLRNKFGVANNNEFVFGYTEQSMDTVTGYNEIRDICKEINIPVITATAIRHRTATLFWRSEHLSEDVVNTFLQHMGHSFDIDRNIYCVPQAVKEITVMAPMIEKLDKVSSTYILSICSDT